MAETCGLGGIGKNGLIFHSSFGPRLILGGIVTTAPLPESTWPERDGGGCPEDCFVCRDICPARAIDRTGKINRPACANYSLRSPLMSVLIGPGKAGGVDMSTLLNTAGVDGNSMYTCTRCVSDCPKC